MRGNSNSWFPMKAVCKGAPHGVFFGPALQNEKTSYVYPDEFIQKDATVIWVPGLKKTVSLTSYERAHQQDDGEALAKISSLGIPLKCDFGGCVKLVK